MAFTVSSFRRPGLKRRTLTLTRTGGTGGRSRRWRIAQTSSAVKYSRTIPTSRWWRIFPLPFSRYS